MLTAICSKQNLGVFIRLGSLGAIFVSMFVLGIVSLGAYGWVSTEYQIGTTLENKATVWDEAKGVRTIVLFTANFSPLASLLNTGYYLHTCAVPIIRNSKKPENSTRNIFMGYTFVFLSYVVIGTCGYIGFIGTLFQNYFVTTRKTPHSGEINQNCLNMFGYFDAIVFVVRLAIFTMLLSTYPLLNLFFRTQLLNLFYENKEVRKRDLVMLNSIVFLIPLTFSIIFPEIGSIIAYSGAFAGFVVVYCLPVIVYLKKKYIQITNPLLAEAITLN